MCVTRAFTLAVSPAVRTGLAAQTGIGRVVESAAAQAETAGMRLITSRCVLGTYRGQPRRSRAHSATKIPESDPGTVATCFSTWSSQNISPARTAASSAAPVGVRPQGTNRRLHGTRVTVAGEQRHHECNEHPTLYAVRGCRGSAHAAVVPRRGGYSRPAPVTVRSAN